MPKAFDYLEAQTKGRFLAGDHFSIADLAIVSNLINYQYLGYAIDRARHPGLAALVRHTIARPEMQSILAAEKPFAEQMGLDRGFLS
jgi:glutathione S-transferase